MYLSSAQWETLIQVGITVHSCLHNKSHKTKKDAPAVKKNSEKYIILQEHKHTQARWHNIDPVCSVTSISKVFQNISISWNKCLSSKNKHEHCWTERFWKFCTHFKYCYYVDPLKHERYKLFLWSTPQTIVVTICIICFDIQKLYTVPTQYIKIFCVNLTINGSYIPKHQWHNDLCNGHVLSLWARK